MSNEVYIAGIDLGTTNSCIGCIKDGRVEIVCNEFGSRMNPSMVAFTSNGTFYGNGAKHFLLRGNQNTIYGIKRIIGQNFSSPAVQDEIPNLNYRIVQGPNDNPRIFVKVGDEESCYPPEVISAMVIRYLVDMASKRVEHAISKIVITCPAYFNEKQRRATRDAGEIAGYEVLAVLNEPAAAAIAYGYDKQMENKTLLVYDLGGGTFDITVFRMNESEDQVLGYAGDSHCGGIDLDRIMEKIMIRHMQANGESIDLSNSSLRMKLRSMAEEVKITLSSTDFCEVPLEDFQEFTVTREEFIQEAGGFFAKTIRIVKDLLAKLALSPDDIDEVLLVGGSSNIPQVATELSAVFGESKVSREINVEEAVTYGATLYAYHQCRCKEILSSFPEEDFLDSFTEDSLLKIPVIVMDVVPISYGIEVMNHKFSRIVEANTPLNQKKTKLYQTNYDNQRELIIIIYQGEEDDCRNDVVVGQFVIRDLPPGKAGKVKVEVTMEVDFEFTLHVHAKVVLTGQELSVSIQKGVINLSKMEKEKWKKKRELDRVNSDRRLQRTDLVNEIKSCLESIQERLEGEEDSFKTEVKEDAEEFLEQCSPEALSGKSISELEELLQRSKDWVSYLQFVFCVCWTILVRPQRHAHSSLLRQGVCESGFCVFVDTRYSSIQEMLATFNLRRAVCFWKCKLGERTPFPSGIGCEFQIYRHVCSFRYGYLLEMDSIV